MSDQQLDDAASIAAQLTFSAINEQFSGYDPFDGLNSKLFHALGLDRSRLLRLAWLQFHKLSPVNLRPLVRVPKTRNAKAIAVFLLAMVRRYRRSADSQALTAIRAAADLLCADRIQSTKWPGSCWGYPFPWQARAFYVPVGTPNGIASAYASLALAEVFEITGWQPYLDVAVDAATFFDRVLFVDSGEQSFYQYIPGENAFVHNASLWAAHAVIFGAKQTGNDSMRERALRAVRHTVSCQNTDGSWLYGNLPHHRFIDGFHTGYNIETLLRISKILDTNEFAATISNGADYYRNVFFATDGRVSYYSDKSYPLDSHAFAQAIITLCMLPDEPRNRPQVRRVVDYVLTNMFLPRHCRFVYQKRRFFVNRVHYLRWTQAWMAYALECWVGSELAKGQIRRSFG